MRDRGREDVLFLYAPPWDGPTRFSKHHLASHFAAQGRRVLYVEAPLTPLSIRRGRAFANEFRRTLLRPRQAAARLWVARQFLPLPYHAFSRLTSARATNRIGQCWLMAWLRRDLRRLRMRAPIVMAGLPHAADALRWLPRRALVYHCADDYASVRGFPSTLPAVEAELCRASDLVIATSQTLCHDRKRWNPNTHWVPNGADVEHFSRAAQPASELHHLGSPVIGFVGGLSEWVDIDLVASLASARPQWTFVLVGPVAVDVSALRALDNVHLLGPRPYASLPNYLAAMDVAIIPFRPTRVTFHADPIKAYEYLAAGVPVVATDMPALRRLGHVVHLARSNSEFLAHLDASVTQGRQAGRDERQAEAARHSWTARFAQFDTLLDRALCGS